MCVCSGSHKFERCHEHTLVLPSSFFHDLMRDFAIFWTSSSELCFLTAFTDIPTLVDCRTQTKHTRRSTPKSSGDHFSNHSSSLCYILENDKVVAVCRSVGLRESWNRQEHQRWGGTTHLQCLQWHLHVLKLLQQVQSPILHDKQGRMKQGRKLISRALASVRCIQGLVRTFRVLIRRSSDKIKHFPHLWTNISSLFCFKGWSDYWGKWWRWLFNMAAVSEGRCPSSQRNTWL